MFFKLILFVVALILSVPSYAVLDGARADGHAPIGAMGEHVHAAGEWMLSYRYMSMAMDGNRSGTGDVSVAQVHNDFMIAPTQMDMQMHMVGVMLAPYDHWTFMVMAPFVRKTMDHRARNGRTFTTETDGLGDIKLDNLLRVYEGSQARIHLNAGLSLPTGSIDERGDTLMPNQPLPYPMQLGSGTFDFIPGLTYNGQSDLFSWGGQVLFTFRGGNNDNGYSLGGKTQATLWSAWKIIDSVSTSLRLNSQSWGDIRGSDKRLSAMAPQMVPTADPDRRAGDRVDLSWGVNLYALHGFLRGHRLAFEWALPIYQRLDGPQLETDHIFTIGWQKAF